MLTNIKEFIGGTIMVGYLILSDIWKGLLIFLLLAALCFMGIMAGIKNRKEVTRNQEITQAAKEKALYDKGAYEGLRATLRNLKGATNASLDLAPVLRDIETFYQTNVLQRPPSVE